MKKWFFPAAAAITAALMSAVTYARLPEMMAVHFNAAESPDNWFSKPIGAFLMPALILIVSWMFMLSLKLEKDENKRRRAEAAGGSIMAVVSVTLLAVHSFIIAYNLGYKVSAAIFATIIAGVVFVTIGNLVPRLPQGSMQWPRLSDHVQRKASRSMGRIMVTAGFGFLLLPILPVNYISPIFFILLALFIVVIIASMIKYTRSG